MSNIYKTIIADNRYLLILKGLANTIIITIGSIIKIGRASCRERV